jgi:hypothetical protein
MSQRLLSGPRHRNLPATDGFDTREAAALAYAKAKFRSWHAGDTPWSGDSPLTQESGRAFARWIFELGAGDANARLDLVNAALAGERNADILLDQWITQLQSAGYALPKELAFYDMQIRRYGRPKQPRGPKKANNIVRNLMIMLVARALTDRFGLHLLKTSPIRRSACEIVAEALLEVGIVMSDRGVRAIVEQFEGAWPTQRGWAATW